MNEHFAKLKNAIEDVEHIKHKLEEETRWSANDCCEGETHLEGVIEEAEIDLSDVINTMREIIRDMEQSIAEPATPTEGQLPLFNNED